MDVLRRRVRGGVGRVGVMIDSSDEYRVTDGLNELKGAFKSVNGGAENTAQ